MKFFVTGGAGFIASALVKSLLEKNHDVTIFDNFSNSTKEKISYLVDQGVTVIEGDITNYNSLLKALTDHDFVIHSAAKINVEESILKPDETRNVNITGTINLLKTCQENKVNKIIALSSASVYGIPSELPITENSPTVSISPYGESKLSMENEIREHSKKHDLHSINLRIFNVYGPNQSEEYAGVITKFMKNISGTKPLTIFGDGTYTRDFISIEDVVNSIECAISNINGKRGKCYNIATGRHVSIKELAKLMVSISGKNLEIKYEAPKADDIPHSQTTIELARKELDFSPKTQLKDGLKKLFEST